MIKFVDMPVEILTHILIQLELNDIKNVMLTCKKLLQHVIHDNALWRKICNKRFILKNVSSGRIKSTRELSPYHKCRVSYNWQWGIYRGKTVLRFNNNYIPWINLEQNQLIISTGSTLQCYPRDRKGFPICNHRPVWHMQVPYVPLPVREIRNNDITRFLVKDNHIVCGNRNGCISVYNQDKEYRTCPRSLRGNHNRENRQPALRSHITGCHEQGHAEVSSVDCAVDNDEIQCIYSSSRDSRFINWWSVDRHSDIELGRLNINDDGRINGKDTALRSQENISFSCERGVNCLYGTACKCIQLSRAGDKLACGLVGNTEPLILHAESGRTLLKPSVQQVTNKETTMDVQWIDNHVVACVTHSGKLSCSDTRLSSPVICRTLDPFLASIYCVRSDGDRALVIGTSQYSRCVLFDLRYPVNHVQIYFTQKQSSPVYSMDFDSSILVSAADRGIAAMDFNINTERTQSKDYAGQFFKIQNSLPALGIN